MNNKTAVPTAIRNHIDSILPGIVNIRRNLHRRPECRFQEFRTADLIERKLCACGCKVKRIGSTGVVGLLEGILPGKTVALRADIDALPIKEKTGKKYASVNEFMHACGHDGHTAILLGAAMVLAQLRKSLAGKIKFIFQPAEEGGLGAKMMCGQGGLKNPDVDAIFALHGWPELKCGAIGIGKDRVSASSNRFSIVVTGRESHGARPEKAIDTILVAARIVEGLQAIVSRQISPLNPVVVTIGSIHGGSSGNTIPGRVELNGTIRYFDDKTRNFVFKSVKKISTCTARALGGDANVMFEPDVPATMNHPKMVAILVRAAKKISKPGNMIRTIPPGMIGEDFAFYLKEAPGAYFFLGLAEKNRCMAPLHNAKFDFNDHALALGIQMMTQAVLEFLGDHNAD